jgi:hypothetical protein
MNICFDQMKEEIKQALTEEDTAAKVLGKSTSDSLTTL